MDIDADGKVIGRIEIELKAAWHLLDLLFSLGLNFDSFYGCAFDPI